MRIQKSLFVRFFVALLFISITAVDIHAAGPVLTVKKDGLGDGIVKSSPSRIKCGAVCSREFTLNRKVTLTVTPDANSTFLGWNGGGCSGAGKCVIDKLSGDTTVTATFGQPAMSVADTLSFDSANTGGTGSQSTITVTNSGAGLLRITGIKLGGPDRSQFRLGSATRAKVEANGGQYPITVTFKPYKGGDMSATLMITSNDPALSSKTIKLTGTAVAVPKKTTITGSVFAAAVGGARVYVKNDKGATIAGPAIAGTDGTYSIKVPTSALSGDLRFETQKGTFTDEAVSTKTAAGEMAAYVKGGSLTTGSSVNITPSSTIIHELVTGQGLTLDDAEAAFSSAFGFSPDDLSTAPSNAPLAGADADTKPQLAFMRAATFSQLTKDLGLSPDKQFKLLTALAQDLADGFLDGKNTSAAVNIETGMPMPEDIQNLFEQSEVSVLGNSTMNKTCLTTAQVGNLAFSKIALTNSYKIEYVPGMMAAGQGKTSFKVKITKISDGSAASGLSISLMPMMHMATMSHSTPVDSVTEDSSNPGTYNCAVYYGMGSGVGEGYWELKVTIGGMSGMSGMSGETAVFYPQVAMSMGSGTVRATLKGQGDTIAGSMGSSQRTYYLFTDGGTTATSFKLFIAAQEDMMSYPAVSSGISLHDALGTAWKVDSMVVSASTDKTAWVDATDNGGGHWYVSGLTGLVSGQQGTIYIKLTVNGELKTTNGKALAADGSNGYQTFTVTP